MIKTKTVLSHLLIKSAKDLKPDTGCVTYHYKNGSAIFECDRLKNTKCNRVRNNLPCGNCRGTKHINFALVK